MPVPPEIGSIPKGEATLQCVLFCNSLPASIGENDCAIDLAGITGRASASLVADSVLAAAYEAHGEAWKRQFVEWLGRANIANAGKNWWSFACIAKNLLSSPLGNRFFQVLALDNIIRSARFRNLYIIGASHGQYQALKGCFPELVRQEGTGNPGTRTPRFHFYWLRIALLALSLLNQVIASRWRMRGTRPNAPDLWLFTYYGSRLNPESDIFYGPLKNLLGQLAPEAKIAYTGFTNLPLPALCSQLRDVATYEHWPLYLELRGIDFVAAALKSVWLTRRSYRDMFHLPPLGNGLPDTTHLLDEALAHDATSGSMLHHILIYRAARRLAARQPRGVIIYPFEAKALERMLIEGIRDCSGKWEITGYQHTSITRRHLTFFLANGESDATPLPDRVLTVGNITRRFLEENCNYPNGLFRTACALRQALPDGTDEPHEPSAPLRILLALSSSRKELLHGIGFMKGLLDTKPGAFRLGIRPHPEFPLSLLPDSLAAWVAEYAEDLSETGLRENLNWCDIVGYVSSTVALEGLMAGKGAIQFSIGDPVEPDPVLGSCPLHWRVANGERFLGALFEYSRIQPARRKAAVKAARNYLADYFAPVTADAVRNFLPAHLRVSDAPYFEPGGRPT